MQIKKIIFLSALLIMFSCNKNEKNLLLAIDCTKSNGKSSIKSIGQLLENSEEGDVITIVPIHARTASAAPIIEKTIPPCEDMNCAKYQRHIINEIERSALDGFEGRNIESQVRLKTSIMPIFSRMFRMETDRTVDLIILSDMIEENNKLNFVETFPKMDKKEIKRLAIENLNQSRDEIDLANKVISIVIPGTQSGDTHNDEFHLKVLLFWETFINAAGGRMTVRYLS